MPEFILDHGTPEAAKQFGTLDSFTQGYIEALFFTNASDPEDDCAGMTVADLAPETLQTIVHDCALFQKDNTDDLSEAIDNGRVDGYDEMSAGRDFWYTRNGHGVGYCNRDLGDVGDALYDAAHGYTARDVYRGDDGKIYLA